MTDVLVWLYSKVDNKQGLELRQFVDQKLTNAENYIKETNEEYISVLRKKALC